MIVTQRTEVPDATLKHKSRDITVEVYRSQHPIDPLTHGGPVTLACSHGRYDLGDEDAPTDQFDSWNEIEQHYRDKYDIVAMTRLYLYDHSGITISSTPFNSRFDSGIVGIGFIREQDMPDYSDSEMDRPSDSEVQSWIEDRVEEYDHYLQGNVYWYELIEDGESVDTCSGFYDVLPNCRNERMWDYIGYDRQDFELVD